MAKELKEVFENEIFRALEVNCFVSDVDIAAGSDWFERIRHELDANKIGILCITKENVGAPWIYFEAGVMVARGVETIIPLLINCDIRALKDTPLPTREAVNFGEFSKFAAMIRDIAIVFGGEKRDLKFYEAFLKKRILT